MLAELPADAVARAMDVLNEVASFGVYSNYNSVSGIRRRIAAALRRRDGCDADPEAIFLTIGASQGADFILQILLRGRHDGVLMPNGAGRAMPIPQYPLYNVSRAMLGCRQVDYYFDEESAWPLHMHELTQRLQLDKVRYIFVSQRCRAGGSRAASGGS